ncbi:Zinc-finger domain of monoamine-oxidase A repressor R1 [Dillenia turbinata]|uniref:Zinc-finger domain of monoamine-oxidase A repressor R1 n=1 Tax=Dillenia turbinata TaxID=194707 RepID=A0AAN8V736_9MAGN
MATPLSTSKTQIIGETRVQVNLPQGKQNKSPGVRVVRSQTYNSQNGKTCHQCRQKTMDIMAQCKNLKAKKPCTIKFCHKCLLNRYGEISEEVANLEDWKCPKCRGICNCSQCMKKRGCQPTGALVKTAKEAGFSSVFEMLHVEGFKNVESCKANGAVGEKDGASFPIKRGKENVVRNGGSGFSPTNAVGDRKQKRVKREDLGSKYPADMVLNDNAAAGEIQLPEGIELSRVAGVDVPAEDVRHASEFLEFCSSVWEEWDLVLLIAGLKKKC